MSLLSKIKSYLPASSRSLHGMFAEVVKLREENQSLLSKLDAIEGRLSVFRPLDAEVASCKEGIDSLDGKVDAFEAQTVGLLWDLYKEEGESLLDAKRRFFKTLPKAEGALRGRQLELANLLKGFDAICKENGVRYFLAIGTLLGALRHEGFVPWDDDVDVGVMREDIDRLADALKFSEEFEITTAYDQYVFCKQVRFKRKGSQERDPFIDLFIYEYSGCETHEDLLAVKSIREDLLTEFIEQNESDPNGYPLWACVGDNNEPIQENLKGLYDEQRKRAFDEGLYVEKERAKSIIWSLENLSFGDPVHIIPIQYFDEMMTATFEGGEYPVLGNSETLLSQHYGDWLKMPRDVYTHFKHDGSM